MTAEYRIERDSMGEVRVPSQAYYGAQTQRAVENFPISGWRLPPSLIHALGLVKFAAAVANRDLGKLTQSGKNRLNNAQVDALLAACREVAAGKFDDQFPVDVFQTGSGTSSNMNANEVIANRAIELLGGDRFQADKPVHPNDHVNMGQSTNDMFPTAIHVAVASSIRHELIPALSRLYDVLQEKAANWDRIIKIGRTHLADATPLRLGQEVGGFARQIQLSIGRAVRALEAVLELPCGGTAVGSGINTHPEFGSRVSAALAEETQIAFVEAQDHFEANAQRDGLVECHGQLKTIASTLFNVANNIRWLGSGPRCGFNEINLPQLQPGSSIMPGKVNPVIPEVVNQTSFLVIGLDTTVTLAASAGQLQLNVMEPVISFALFFSIHTMERAVNSLRSAGYDEHDITVITAAPMEEYEFSHIGRHSYQWYIACGGGLLGLLFGTWLTTYAENSWPIVVGNMPIVAWYPNLIVIFELTMLGAVLSTVATLIVTAGLARRTPALYDPEVSSGAILVGVGTPRADGDVERILGAVPGARVRTV